IGLMLGVFSSLAAQVATDELPPIGKDYSDLRPEQKRLIDDWFQRFSQVIKKKVPPDEGYNHLPLSAKTTFGAVTHALMRTPLTDKQGTPLGDSAIAVIDKIDDVAGKVSDAPGDKQFRIYVQLKPEAMALLSKSQEFKREGDNTVYHHGYPVCYRGYGGAPSIQVSISRDGRIADIDVDYRSSKFPAALFNGHLSAANSDVRAGDNDERHNRRWEGLGNWWRTLLGFPFIEGKSSEKEEESLIAREPRVRKDAQSAMYDFLKSWLVEQKPEVSMGYFSRRAFSCVEAERGMSLDPGMAKIKLLMGLHDLNRRLGKFTDLSQATVGVHLHGPRGKVIKQPHQEQFVLYDVREDLAERFKCENKLNPDNISPKASRSQDFGKYVGAVFKLKAGDQLGETVATLWAKENKRWKLISYDVEPEFDAARIPHTAAAPPAESPSLAYVEADPELVRAASDFAADWLVRKRVDEAFNYMAPASYACVNLYRSEDVPEAMTPAAQAKLTRSGMQKVATKLGDMKTLREAIVAPPISHPELKLVKHANAQAFALISIPDYMAAAADCARRAPGQDLVFDESAGRGYGNAYAMGFKVAASEGDPAALWLVWMKQGGAWRIVSFAVLAP
ncbi:MAG: hypothetical protein L0Z53_05425, partial [Acidobacteriales bacterium]|nr:hypothetical protein [Terriglobales bacterium]